MSVVDHFHKAPEAGFSRSWDAESARRQFNVSLGLIAALAFAAGLLAFSLRLGPAPQVRVVQSPVVQADSGSANFGKLVQP
ncbi:MAG: hypothetical protein U1E28_08075 [Beijerinckiaceae bacterium]